MNSSEMSVHALIHNNTFALSDCQLWLRQSVPVCLLVGWLVACLTSQQHASVSQGRICSDNFTCCHTEIEVEDPTVYLSQSQYTDTGPTSLSADPIMPVSWQGSQWSANFCHWYDSTRKKIPSQAGFESRIFRSRGGRLDHLASEAVSVPVPTTATVAWWLRRSSRQRQT